LRSVTNRESYRLGDAENVFHAELNQYTLTPRLDGGPFGFEHAYDANGNLTYIMEYPRTADLDGNYIVDMGDLQIFQAAFQGEDPIADLNGDEVLTRRISPCSRRRSPTPRPGGSIMRR
jgi:hypothetical protein